MGILAYWVVPNVIVAVGRLSIETIVRYKWFFLGAAVISLGLLVWVIYLRYLLARKSIESQTELEKHRLELEYRLGEGLQRLTEADRAGLVTWEGEILSETGPSNDAPSTDAPPFSNQPLSSSNADADRNDP